MPLDQIIPFGHSGMLATWNILETPGFFESHLLLSPEEENEYQQIRSEKRKKEWLASRHLANILTKKDKPNPILKDNKGKPYFKDLSFKLSLSHSKAYAAVLISKYECGVDIEQIREKTKNIIKRVINEEEIASIPQNDELLYATLFWTAKEAVYKAYGSKGLDFKKQINIGPFVQSGSNYEASGLLLLENEKINYRIITFTFDDFVMTSAFKKE